MENKKIIINVGRQLGSGGRVIAQILAEDFGCKFLDKEILNLAAEESGFCKNFFEQNDENKGFFRSLFHMHVPHMSDNNFYSNRFSQESLFKFQSDAIRKAADESSCVIVGRCGDYILRDYEHVVNIFITADLEERINRVAKRQHCNYETARKILNQKENERSSFYNYYTGKKWGHASSYHLCVNSSILGLEKTAEYIATFIREWFHIS